MKILMDLLVDNGDDIILTDDIDIDVIPMNSVIRTAERRISARYDDFVNFPCAAGLERYIQKKITGDTKAEIETSIRQALYSDAFLSYGEYDVHVIDVGSSKLQILLAFKVPELQDYPELTTFKVMVNLQNQRSLR